MEKPVLFLLFLILQEISEFKKLLKYFNNDLGPAVCIYTIVNLSWAAAGTIWLLRYDNSDMKTNSVTWVEITNVVLWILISIVPFIQVRLFLYKDHRQKR